MNEKRKVLRAAGIVGAFTLLSRFTGLARDSVTAAMFGGSRMADTFLTSLELTNQVRRVLGEGSLSSFIVPLMTERRQNQGSAAGWEFFNRVLNLMLLLSAGITLLGVLFGPTIFGWFGGRAFLLEQQIVREIQSEQSRRGYAVEQDIVQSIKRKPAAVSTAIENLLDSTKRPAWLMQDGQGQLQLTPAGQANINTPTYFFRQGGAMTRLLFPYVIGLTLAAVMMGGCHTLRRFGVPSFGSVVLNIPMIVAGVAAMAWLHPQSVPASLTTDARIMRAAYWLCWGVLIGAALRVLLMVPTLRRNGWRYRAVLNLRDPELQKLLRMMSLGLADVFLSQINFAVSGYFAMFLAEGIKTYISYASRVIQFPMALTATALGTAMLPQLSQFLLEKRHADLRDMMAFIKRLEIVFMLPAVAGLMILGRPILSLIFEHGKFNATDTHGTYLALLFYAPALLPLGWIRMLQPLYFARKDMLTPFKASLASVAVNIALNWYFAYHTDMKQMGMGLANTLAACTNYAMLSWFLRHELHSDAGEHPRIFETFWKTTIAAVAASLIGLFLFNHLPLALLGNHGMLRRALAILPIIGLVAMIYFTIIHFLRVPDGDRAVKMITRRLKQNESR